MIGTLSQIVYSTALAFRLNWKFSLIALCVVPPQVAIILISRKYRLRNAKMIRETSALTGGFLGETVRSMRIVFAYVIEGFVARRFKSLTKRWKKIYKDMLSIEVTVAFIQCKQIQKIGFDIHTLRIRKLSTNAPIFSGYQPGCYSHLLLDCLWWFVSRRNLWSRHYHRLLRRQLGPTSTQRST